MSVRLFTIDSFTSKPFGGNPAGVCILDASADERWMQAFAGEMRHSETAFLVRRADGSFDLRWFTPTVEVALCGHGTLASAHALWTEAGEPKDRPLSFHTKSGLLTCSVAGGRIEMDFPAKPCTPAEAPAGLLEALGVQAVFVGRNAFDYLVEVDDEQAVRKVTPDFPRLAKVKARGVILTARSTSPGSDFTSRFFAPASGVDEDPVTGSAHCCLAPYWAGKLGKSELVGFQASARSGTVHCRLAGDRVLLGGTAVTVWRGELAT
jgi:PhzF family phenazine biosynthesis protein